MTIFFESLGLLRIASDSLSTKVSLTACAETLLVSGAASSSLDSIDHCFDPDQCRFWTVVESAVRVCVERKGCCKEESRGGFD